MPGGVMGLNVVLNIDQKNYMKNGLTSSAGVRVTLHSPEVRPLVDEFGHDVQPARATNFAIEKVKQPRSFLLTWIFCEVNVFPGAVTLGHSLLLCLVRH